MGLCVRGGMPACGGEGRSLKFPRHQAADQPGAGSTELSRRPVSEYKQEADDTTWDPHPGPQIPALAQFSCCVGFQLTTSLKASLFVLDSLYTKT